MARIENQPKVILTQEEREILRRAQSIIVELGTSDSNYDVYCACENDASEWFWIEEFIEKLIYKSEIE